MIVSQQVTKGSVRLLAASAGEADVSSGESPVVILVSVGGQSFLPNLVI